MMLAFATFIGLGGDDIPKTIFSIAVGLVFAAVGPGRDFRTAPPDLLRHTRVLTTASTSWYWRSASTA